MKRIKVVIFFVSYILCAFTDGSHMLAQNMATESYTTFTFPDSTDYHIEQCPHCLKYICGIGGFSGFEEAFEKHLEAEHKEIWKLFYGELDPIDDGFEEPTGGNSNNNSQGNDGGNYFPVFDISKVAVFLNRNGICETDLFLDYYSSMVKVNETYALVSTLETFFRNYNLINDDINLYWALQKHYSFLILRRPEEYGVINCNGVLYVEYEPTNAIIEGEIYNIRKHSYLYIFNK